MGLKMTRFFEWKEKVNTKDIVCLFCLAAILFSSGLLFTFLGSTADDERHQHTFEGGVTLLASTVCMLIFICVYFSSKLSCHFRKNGENQRLLDCESQEDRWDIPIPY